MRKGIYPKILSYIIINGEILKVFTLRSGKRYGYPLSPLPLKNRPLETIKLLEKEM